MQTLSLKEIAVAVGGSCETDCEITSVCIDTRKIVSGCLYVAIKGERFDGHSFTEKAYEAGAAAAMSSQPASSDKPVVYVEDTRLAFGALSSYYRSKFALDLIGVTGSVGKTSTKEMIATVMSCKYPVLKTQGNLNNDIGLPRTLLELDNSYGGAVIEMGMSALGEISYLSRLAKPTLGVITNVGVSHLENLGTRENILKAKLELLDGMEPQAKLILNADNDMLYSVKEELGERALYFGIEQDGAVTASKVVQVGREMSFTIHYDGNSFDAVIPTIGVHNVYNALAAFLVGIEIGLEPKEIIASFLHYENAGMRQRMSEYQGIQVIEDCYNASPDSMQSAVNVISSVDCSGKRIAVFGDMLELGEHSKNLHAQVGQMATKGNIDCLYCFGTESKAMYDAAVSGGMREVYHETDKEKLAQQIKKQIKCGDAIIFKASRGIRLEEVIETLFPPKQP